MESTTQLQELKIGFIGGGNMARAIAIPLIEKGIIKAENVYVSAKTEKTLDIWRQIKSENPVNTTQCNAEIAIKCDVIFLAVKPQVFDSALTIMFTPSNSIHIQSLMVQKLIISVIAGLPIATIEEKFEPLRRDKFKLIRTMPNMAVSVGQGTTAYCCNEDVGEEEKLLMSTLFSHLGAVEEVPENQMDVAGALVGSGPAFAYLMMEALADGAVKNGMTRALALKLAGQMFMGAGKMVVETGKHPGQLKDEVCSPGGTTIAGIHALEQGAVRGSLINAIEAAVRKTKEITSSK